MIFFNEYMNDWGKEDSQDRCAKQPHPSLDLEDGRRFLGSDRKFQDKKNVPKTLT